MRRPQQDQAEKSPARRAAREGVTPATRPRGEGEKRPQHEPETALVINQEKDGLDSRNTGYTPVKGKDTPPAEARGLPAPGDLSGTVLSDLLPKMRPKIRDIAAELPEAGREAFVRTVEVAAALAMGGKASLAVIILKREHRYREMRAVYEKAPTAENAASLKAVLESLRAKQRELLLPPEPTDKLASHAYSQVRPSRAKAEPHSPGKPSRGRPKISAASLQQ